jgi:hypothetical protein
VSASPIIITSKNAEVAGSEARITSPALATHLIQNQGAALDVLHQVAPVNASDISVDQQGRVVISNANFANTLQSRINAGSAADNHGCGAGCARPGASAVENTGG